MDMFRNIMRLFRQLVVQAVDLPLLDLGLFKVYLIISTYRGDIIVTASKSLHYRIAYTMLYQPRARSFKNREICRQGVLRLACCS